MKIGLVGADLFHADGRTDRHDKANSYFFAILLTRLKLSFLPFLKRCTLLCKITQCSHIANECINMQIRRKIFTQHREVGMNVKLLGLS